MGRIKDMFRGEHKGFVWFVTASTSFFIFLWIVGPGNTIIHWVQAKMEISRQEKRIEAYRQEIEEMDKRARTIRTDRDTLEKFAREQFTFAVPGEDVYIVD